MNPPCTFPVNKTLIVAVPAASSTVISSFSNEIPVTPGMLSLSVILILPWLSFMAINVVDRLDRSTNNLSVASITLSSMIVTVTG